MRKAQHLLEISTHSLHLGAEFLAKETPQIPFLSQPLPWMQCTNINYQHLINTLEKVWIQRPLQIRLSQNFVLRELLRGSGCGMSCWGILHHLSSARAKTWKCEIGKVSPLADGNQIWISTPARLGVVTRAVFAFHTLNNRGEEQLWGEGRSKTAHLSHFLDLAAKLGWKYGKSRKKIGLKSSCIEAAGMLVRKNPQFLKYSVVFF